MQLAVIYVSICSCMRKITGTREALAPDVRRSNSEVQTKNSHGELCWLDAHQRMEGVDCAVKCRTAHLCHCGTCKRTWYAPCCVLHYCHRCDRYLRLHRHRLLLQRYRFSTYTVGRYIRSSGKVQKRVLLGLCAHPPWEVRVQCLWQGALVVADELWICGAFNRRSTS